MNKPRKVLKGPGERSQRRFEDMDRAELLATKQTVSQQLAQVNRELEAARQAKYALGQSWTALDSPKLESRRVNLVWIQGRVNAELKRYAPEKGAKPSALLAENFQKIAKQLLEPALYDHLLEQAKQLD